MRPEALALVEYWECLTPQALARLATVYTEDAFFKDPFNEVRGLEAMRAVFDHMFETLEEPRFTVREVVAEERSAMLVWDFTFRVKSLRDELPRCIHGASHIRFAADGRVSYHRDYWDAAGELYAQLPYVGPLARWLARRFAGLNPR